MLHGYDTYFSQILNFSLLSGTMLLSIFVCSDEEIFLFLLLLFFFARTKNMLQYFVKNIKKLLPVLKLIRMFGIILFHKKSCCHGRRKARSWIKGSAVNEERILLELPPADEFPHTSRSWQYHPKRNLEKSGLEPDGSYTQVP